MRQQKRHNPGFTLVELLVVIGVIAVLMAILVPVLAKARAAANRTACLSNIRQIGMAVLMYCHTNRGYFPTCAWPDDTISYVPYPDDWIHWQANRNLTDSAIARYVSNGKDPGKLAALLRCPSDRFEGRKPFPSIRAGQGPYMYSYSLHNTLGFNDKVPIGQYRTKITMWRAPYKKVMLSETGDQSVYMWMGHAFESYPSPAWGVGNYVSTRHGTVRFRGNVPGNPYLTRGNIVGSKASTIFIDGHTESIEQEFSLDPLQIQNNPRGE